MDLFSGGRPLSKIDIGILERGVGREIADPLHEANRNIASGLSKYWNQENLKIELRVETDPNNPKRKVELDFTIKTKMDEPFGFNFVDGIADAFETKVTRGRRSEKIEIEDVAMLPGRLLGGMAKGATDATIAVIDGALAVGKSLTEAILGVFKKSPSPQE